MLNQIHLFRAMNAYLSVVFIVGLTQSVPLYLAVIRLVKKGPSRCPRLLRLVGKNALALVTPSLMFPLIASLLLTIGQCVASFLSGHRRMDSRSGNFPIFIVYFKYLLEA